MRAMSTFLALALTACGFYPLGDEGHAPSASKEQLLAFLDTCEIVGAQVDEGTLDGETEWVVAMGEQPQAKWDCLSQQKEQAGVIATTAGFVTENM